MGLALGVGIYADYDDEKGIEHLDQLFATIAQTMIEAGLPAHIEPKEVQSWSAEGYGYSGLHALREVAAIIWKGQTIPRQTLISGRSNTNLADELFTQALKTIQPMPEKPKSFLARLFGTTSKAQAPTPSLPPFSHLVVHSDAEGFYVPTDFVVPLVPKVMHPKTASIWPLGSTQRLKSEIDLIAAALEIPETLGSQDEELWQALEAPVTDKELWRAQPIAAYSAVILRDACIASLETGAAIAFQ